MQKSSPIRRWLQRRATKNIEHPKPIAIVDDVDLTLNSPSVGELLEVDILNPKISKNFWIQKPRYRGSFTDSLSEFTYPEVAELLDSWPPTSLSPNLAEQVLNGKVDGTLFFQTNEPSLGERRSSSRSPVITPAQRRASMTQQRALIGQSIFELLLPVLLPPPRTEFGQDLLMPQELYPFQNYGVRWLVENESALLADDMGLGKTVQAITAFRLLVRQGAAMQCLVICPKSVVTSWRHHFEEWAPDLQVATISGSKQVREFQWAAYAGKTHALIVNYELLRGDASKKVRNFDLIIADEVQRIKNPSTRTSQIVRRLPSKRRWGLTGTPLENRIEDVVVIMNFIKPEILSQATTVSQVRKKLKPYFLRRKKEDVLKQLPPISKDIRYVELDEAQRKTYEQAERTGRIELEKGTNITVQHVLALITKLKQICDFDPVTNKSGKLDWLDGYLETAVNEDSKVLVVSQFVDTLDRLEPHFQKHFPLKFTGKLSTVQRDKVVEQFQNNSVNRVLLMSLRAGGVGITLTAANYVVLFDSWWNPAIMDQAIARTHRIGQEKKVFATTLIAENTIEERIELLLEQKRSLFQSVIGDLSDAGLQKVLSEEELFGLFDLKPKRLSQEKETTKPVAVSHGKPGLVFNPQEPYSNITKLREILRECEEYIWWEDPHFGQRALEELVMIVDPSQVNQIRILSRQAQFTDNAKRDFKRFHKEMTAKGISVEWRVTKKSIAHDRYLITRNFTYNLPPVNSIYEGSYGEALHTTNRPPFEEWWQQAIPAI